ncbi:MAG: YHS domain-containing protein [Ignavibacteria bacterium]|nr:YHS domain-containing protein [Ignavibacteria bacterium]MBT8382377.1 YHS domain-containing protein [Ignavibacteria bacterium]MBT8391837.1 YHS domain-containing protein [Ignavibacteria bacterium]NNJ51898.1 YHS domain-containing protein [Ignavibacteriaceae bacterium]NNL21106.1 YHS domain-containing protein [Ignavibacteriaceae bacterium]
MLKQILFICSMVVLVSILTLGQENPDKEKEENSQTEEIMTSDSLVKSEELPTEIAWNKVCPVEGGPVEDDTPTVEYDGKLYGFCCPGCDTEFANNPEKYSKNLNESGTRFIGRK